LLGVEDVEVVVQPAAVQVAQLAPLAQVHHFEFV
jgi:hypothetical protein